MSADKIIVGKDYLQDVEEMATLRACSQSGVLELGTRSLTAEPYENIEVIGQGGEGLVFASKQKVLEREVAIKILRPDRRGEQSSEKLIREAKLTAALEHPNIVPVYDLIETEQGQGVVMKQLDGRSWKDLLVDNSLSMAEHLEIFLKVCDAIAYAHSKDIVHRDIKPANVLVGEYGEVYVADWGFAGHPEEFGEAVIGTPGYMAPEMLMPREEPGIGKHTDIYLLGATLYHVISGAPPHRGSDIMQSLASIAQGPKSLSEEVPLRLARICETAMAFDIEQRFDSVLAFKQSVTDYLAVQGSLELVAAGEVAHENMLLLIQEEAPSRQLILDEYNQARFAYEHALRNSPGLQEAQENLRALQTAAIQSHLKSNEPGLALLVAKSSSSTPIELLKQCERLDSDARRQRAKLEREDRQKARVGVFVWMLPIIAVHVLASAAGMLLIPSLGSKTSMIVFALPSILLAVGALVFSHHISRNRWVRFGFASLLALFLLELVPVLASVWLDLSEGQLYFARRLVALTVFVMIAVAYDIRFLGAALVFFVGTLSESYLGRAAHYAIAVDAATAVAAILILGLRALQSRQEEPVEGTKRGQHYSGAASA